MKRCFVALTLPAASLDALEALQTAALAALERRGESGVRRTSRDNLHLTLKFLGAVGDAQVEPISAALRSTLTGQSLPPIELAQLGAFPSVERPKAVFVDVVSGRPAVIALMAQLDAALEPLGFPGENRARAPHVTFLRCNGDRRPALSEWIRAQPGTVLGSLDRSCVVLFESVLRPGGSLYTPLVRLPLG